MVVVLAYYADIVMAGSHIVATWLWDFVCSSFVLIAQLAALLGVCALVASPDCRNFATCGHLA